MDKEQIFTAAAEIGDPQLRAQYLDEACRENAPLREEIEELLKHDVGASSFLHQPATVVYHRSSEAVGATIAGRYKLLEEIAEGGMGTVWVAEQTQPVRRRVALKLIKPGMDSRQVLSRFEAERQALALMDHPNIAKVLDGGVTEQGRPYFVMEYVKGVPITEYCDEAKVSVDERLELFMQVCQAVQHAHQKGIIHRDLKPSNILVCLYDGKPVPKVIDFGLAKAMYQPLTEHTVYTAHGFMVGTPLYMSPEQAEFNNLDIDTRTDVYSLGVILYELLTGTTPLDRSRFQDAALQEIVRLIKEEEPSKPSTKVSGNALLPSIAAQRSLEPAQLSRAIRGDLDWIVMKSLEKDRSRRYETASGFARDLERYMRDDPVEARPPSAGYRFRKFARRNRTALLAGSLIAIAAVLGTAISTWQAVRATHAERDALAHAELARQSAQNETVQRKRAEEVSSFLVSAFRSPDPERDGRTITIAEVLDRASVELQEKFAKDPPMQATLLKAIGDAYHGLGLYDDALPVLEKVQRLRTSALGADHPDTLRALHALALIYTRLGRYDEAVALNETTAARFEDKLGTDDLRTLESMVNLASSYRDVDRRLEALQLHEKIYAQCLAEFGPTHERTLSSMTNLAASYFDMERFGDAAKLLEAAMPEIMNTLGPENSILQIARTNLSSCYHKLGKNEEALKLQQEILAFQDERLGVDHPITLESRIALALAYHNLHRSNEALKLREETLPLLKAKLGPKHPQTARAMNDLAVSYGQLGRVEEAIKLHETAFELRKSQLGADHFDTLLSMLNLGQLYCVVGRTDEGVELLENALERVDAKPGPDVWLSNVAKVNLAEVYNMLGRHEEALKLREEELSRIQAQFGENHPDAIQAMSDLAVNYTHVGRKAEAIKLFETIAARRTKHVPDKVDTLGSELNVASALFELGRREEATQLLEECLPIVEAKFGLDHQWGQSAILNLAIFYDSMGRHEDARKLNEKALSVFKVKLGEEHPQTLLVLVNLTGNLLSLGKPKESLELCEKVLPVLKVKLGPDHPLTNSAMTNLAASYAHLGRHAEAVPLNKAVLDLRTSVLGAEHPDTLISRGNLADNYRSLDRHVEAVELDKETLRLARKMLKANDPALHHMIGTVAVNHLIAGQPNEAIALGEELVPLLSTRLGPEHPETLGVQLWLADAYRTVGKNARANELFLQFKDAHLRALAEVASDDWQRLSERAATEARAGEWQKAAADFKAAIAAHPENHDLWYQCAPLWLMSGDSAAYRVHCRDMLSRFGDTSDPVVAERTAKACSLDADADLDRNLVVALAERALTGTEQHPYRHYFLLARSLAEYRSGNLEHAAALATACLSKNEPIVNCCAPGNLVLAMAQQRLGHKDRAEAAFTQARSLLDNEQATGQVVGSPDLGPEWHDKVMIHLLQREAETLVGQ